MCEFARVNPENPKEPPMCNFTGQRCTLCIMGDKSTYNKAKMSQFVPQTIKAIRLRKGYDNGKEINR